MKRLAVSVPLVIGLLVGLMLWSTREPNVPTPEAVEISSVQQPYDTLTELLDDTTIVVVGTVDRVEVGQTYTDPNNPNAGFVSQLANIDVEATLFGVSTLEVIVEQEATLLNGAPIMVGGANSLAEGDRVMLFLVKGTTTENRHFGIVGAQGRYEIDEASNPAVLRVIGLDPNSSIPSFDGLEIEEAKRRISLQ